MTALIMKTGSAVLLLLGAISLLVGEVNAQCEMVLPFTDEHASVPSLTLGGASASQTLTCNAGFSVGGTADGATTYGLSCGATGEWSAEAGAENGCEDINECDSVDCGPGGQCINQPGSYVCVCDAADIFAAGNCTGKYCAAPPVADHAQREMGGRVNGDKVKFTCFPGYGVDGDEDELTFEVECNGVTGEWGAIEDQCKDIDECKPGFDNDCSVHADCLNVPGSYLCVCKHGYFNTYGHNGHIECVEDHCPVLPVDLRTAFLDGTLNLEPEVGDKVTYQCKTGFRVAHYEGYLDPALVNLYQFTQHSFTVQCLENGKWSMWPLPYCHQKTCGDPGHILHATRSADTFYVGDRVDYSCKPGFRLENPHLGVSSFYRECLETGYWSDTTQCVDIDECSEHDELCGKKFCINNEGSYKCSCAPIYDDNHEEDSKYCLDHYFPTPYPTEYPETSPCTLMQKMGACIHGYCKEFEGHAECRCNPGYSGYACDTPIMGLPIILVIICLILILILTILIIVICCCNPSMCYGRHSHVKTVPSVGEVYDSGPGLMQSAPRFQLAYRQKQLFM